MILNMVRPGSRVGYQKVIDRFFSETGLAHKSETFIPPDKSAFIRARHKLPLDAITSLYERAVDKSQELAAPLAHVRWKGFRVLAIDGTKKNLPFSKELAEVYGIPYGAHYPQMLSCALYDVLAKTPLNFMWGPYDTSERTMAVELIKDLGPNDLLLLDRGYPGFELFEKMIAQGIDFLVRLPENGLFGSIQKFLAQGRRDGIVTIEPSAEIVRQRLKEGEPPPCPITLRVLKMRLPGKGSGVFVTTLTDRKRYSLSELRELYHLRWEEEEFFKLIKELLEAENFRGKNCHFIDQEIVAIYLYCLLVRIMIMEAANEYLIPVDEVEQKSAFLAVSRFVDKIWTSETIDECEENYRRCIREISWRRYIKRPHRSYPRKSKSSFGKWGLR